MILPIVMLTFVAFAFAIIWRPSTVLAFAVCIYPFEQWAQANSSFFAVNSAAINYGLGLLTLFALGCVILRGNNPMKPMTAAFWVWLVLYIFAGVSCLWSLDRTTSLFLFKYNAPYAITFVAMLPLVIQNREDVRIGLLTTLVFGSIVMFLLLLDTGLHDYGRTIEAKHAVVDRVGGTRTRLAPLAVAEMAGQLILVAVLLTFSGVGNVWTALRWIVVFVGAALIFRSQSRGQAIATLLTLMVFITFSRGTNRAWGWVAAIGSTAIIIAIVSVAFFNYADMGGRWDVSRMQDTVQSTRIEFSKVLLNYWAQSSPFHWFFGLGSSASYDNRIIGFYCHVVIVEILAELGVVGFVLAMAFMALVTRDAVRLYQLTKNNKIDRGAVVTLVALFFFQILLTFKERSFLTHTFTIGAGLMICRYYAVMRLWQKRERTRAMQEWHAKAARYAQSQLRPVVTSS